MGRRPKASEERFELPVATKVDPALMQEIKKICRVDNRSMSFIAREALREFVERRGKAAIA
jgi:predicted transcriptional regulator